MSMYKNFSIVAAGDMSATVTSNTALILKANLVSIQAVWTGSSPTGTFTLQASNDDGYIGGGTVYGVSNWTILAGSSYAITASGDYLWNISNPAYKWLRLVYTFSSGTGTLNARLNMKGEV